MGGQAVRLRIDLLDLVGAERRYEFQPGLNIITGPVATGKTTLVRCMRGLVGSGLQNLPVEARHSIISLAGRLTLQNDEYEVVRPFVSTTTAPVDIAGTDEALRLPALQPTESEAETYGVWLLRRLGIPHLRVPTSRAANNEDTTLLSINDFMLYCHLRQDEIDTSVFGHDHPSKDSKRRYVFETNFGRYDDAISTLDRERREATVELRRLTGQERTISEFLEGSGLGNRADVERQLREAVQHFESLQAMALSTAREATGEYQTTDLVAQLREADSQLDRLRRRLEYEQVSRDRAQELSAQLRTESSRLTKSIVAGELLVDFDFRVCPRCGNPVSEHRSESGVCYLCLQDESPTVKREDLIHEQDRVERQLGETRQVVETHQESIVAVERQLSELEDRRESLASEIEYRSQTFVTESASVMVDIERRRAEARATVDRLQEVLAILDRTRRDSQRIRRLENRIAEISAELEAASSDTEDRFQERVRYLEKAFREGLQAIRPPRYQGGGYTGIDKRTYLPILDGRQFSSLQSPGLKEMVNVAHAVAHQLTAIHFGLPLPNLLIIDGMSANSGYRGLDMARIEAMYDYVASVATQHSGVLQVFIVDNTVPDAYDEAVAVRLSDDDKLIPSFVLSGLEGRADQPAASSEP